jgi:galactokinase
VKDSHFKLWVPGRLELFGTHTDYAGGRALVAALPRGFVFAAVRRPDDVVEVIAEATGERAIAGVQTAAVSWQHYLDAVVSRLDRNFPGSHGGATISFTSNLPPAAGMSSSSALMVGIASIIIRLRNLDTREEWKQNIRDAGDRAVYFACIENGSAFRDLPGHQGVGTQGGSEDHAAMLIASPMMLSAFSFVPLRHIADAPMPPDWRFVIASSGAAAEKTGAVRDDYNRLSRAASALLECWNAENPPAPSLGAALDSREDGMERLRAIIHRRVLPEWSVEALDRRLQHFHEENQIVLDARRALEHADAAALSDLSARSQANAEGLLGNQIPETMALVRGARACGALAARSFGAGFGGSVWALVPSDRAASFEREWIERYRREHPRRAAVSFVAVPGPPLAEIEPEAGSW